MLKRKILLLGSLAALSFHAQAEPFTYPLSGPSCASVELSGWSPGTSAKQVAAMGAVADSLSTRLAILRGAAERNPLVSTNVPGLIGLAALKIGLTELVDQSSLTPEEKQNTHATFGGVYFGAATNNLAILLGATNGAAIPAGLATGLFVWHWNKYRACPEQRALSAAIAGTAPIIFEPLFITD